MLMAVQPYLSDFGCGDPLFLPFSIYPYIFGCSSGSSYSRLFPAQLLFIACSIILGELAVLCRNCYPWRVFWLRRLINVLEINLQLKAGFSGSNEKKA
jgi:hypothetical protein